MNGAPSNSASAGHRCWLRHGFVMCPRTLIESAWSPNIPNIIRNHNTASALQDKELLCLERPLLKTVMGFLPILLLLAVIGVGSAPSPPGTSSIDPSRSGGLSPCGAWSASWRCRRRGDHALSGASVPKRSYLRS